MARPETTSRSSFKSALDNRAERYLAQQVVYALEHGWRTADDFLRHFGPKALMEALAHADELRSEILVKAAGVHSRLATKKSLESGAEDLQLALDEGITKPEDVLELFPPDDRVRYLDPKKLWTFLTEDEFFFTLPAEEQLPRAVERMTFMVEEALAEGIVSLQTVADGITFDEISRRLPPVSLQHIVKHALLAGRLGVPLTEEMLLEAVPLDAIVRFVPLDHIWNEVIIGKVARPEGFLPAESEASAPTAAPAPSGTAATSTAPTATASASNAAPASSPPPPANSAQPASPPSSGSMAAAKPVSVSPVPPAVGAARSAAPPIGASAPRTMPPPMPPKKKKSAGPPPMPGALPAAPASVNSGKRDPDVDIDTTEFDDEMGDSARAMLQSNDISPGPGRTPQDEARRRVTRALEKISRLPPSHEKLPVPVLLSVESMYAELPSLQSDERREACIRDSFPNEAHLRTAMLALVELLDPTVDVRDPLIAEADIESLISLVLFEENRRADLVVRSSANPPPLPPVAAPRR